MSGASSEDKTTSGLTIPNAIIAVMVANTNKNQQVFGSASRSRTVLLNKLFLFFIVAHVNTL